MIPARFFRTGKPHARPLAALIAAALAIAPPGSAIADTFTVSSCADDGGSGTLRYIIAHVAHDNDTVDTGQLTCATITLTQGQIEIAQPNLTIEHKYHAGFQKTTTIRTNAGVGNPTPGRILHHTGGGTLFLAGLNLGYAALLGSPPTVDAYIQRGTLT